MYVANKKSSVPGDAVNLRKKRIKIGNLTMEVVQGDITEERTDVIVNSTNKNLNLVGGNFSFSLPPTLSVLVVLSDISDISINHNSKLLIRQQSVLR